jgi:nucleosome assembly protein 1-like 1
MQKEMEAIELKFSELYKPIDNSREELVNGKRVPNAEELQKAEEYKVPQKVEEKPEIDFEEMKKQPGIPEFWLKALKCSPQIDSMIQPNDLPALKLLTNIKHELMGENVKQLL